jgi:hypothetical protein
MGILGIVGKILAKYQVGFNESDLDIFRPKMMQKILNFE